MILLAASCAPTVELKDTEMEQLLDKAMEEYEEVTRELEETAVIEEEPDELTIQSMEERAEKLFGELPELAINLEHYRSRLSDRQALAENKIPESYLQTEEHDRRESNNRGFRIQIISTQDARLADDIQRDFEEWIRSVSAPPYAHTYMVFQAPYYRVHIGDFHKRENAMEFTEFIRLRYPDAWVVHSRIHPDRVP